MSIAEFNYTTSSRATITAQDFLEVSDAFFGAESDAEAVEAISIQRSIDWLLDLYQSDERPKVRKLIAEVIEDIQMLGSIDDADTEDLVLGALASVEAAIDMANDLGRW